MRRSRCWLPHAFVVCLMLATRITAYAREPLLLVVSPPSLLDLRSGAGGSDPASAALLYQIMTEELERSGVTVVSMADTVIDSAELIRRAAGSGYQFALVSFIVREPGRLGFGLNIYDTQSGYILTGRLAFGASELALSLAMTRELQTLAGELEAYLRAQRLERESAVTSITFVTPQRGVTLTLADGRSWNMGDEGLLTLTEINYRVGGTIAFTVSRNGYYPYAATQQLRHNDARIELPPLAVRTRLVAGLRIIPAHLQGAGAALRWYPLPDELFTELSGAALRIDSGSRLAKDIEPEVDGLQGGSISAFRLTDLTFSLGAYLFAPRERLLRPGLQTGIGAMSAEGDNWELTLPYLAPLNVFVSIGRGRLRGRVASSMRYVVGSDALDRRWLVHDGIAPYAWFEVGYTW